MLSISMKRTEAKSLVLLGAFWWILGNFQRYIESRNLGSKLKRS